MANPSGTGVVSLNSDLVRKSWIKEGLLQKAAKSWWAPYKGHTRDSIIQQVNNISAGAGHTVVFDMKGALEGRPVRGKQTAEGTGEQKKKFSDKLTLDVFRYTVDNGDSFDGVNIGDLSINQHADSRSLLGDLWIRSADQAYFDLGQQTAEFGLDFEQEFTFDKLLMAENVVKMGEGFATAPSGFERRLPLQPFTTQDGRPIWLMIIDNPMKIRLLRATGGSQAFFSATDVRGNSNRLISGVVGRIGNFLVVEAPTFFGTTDGDIVDSQGYYNYDNTGTYASGLRQYITKSSKKFWSGTKEFDDEVANVDGNTVKRYSRGLIVGAGAFHFAMGKSPDYHFKSHDFDKFSESCLEVWCGARSIKLQAENEDYKAVSVAGYNYGTVFVDLELK